MFNKSKIKSFLFSILKYLPEELGDLLYHYLQNLTAPSLDFKIKSSYNSYQQLEKIALKVGVDFQGMQIIELGSGWLPLLPYFFKYIGNSGEIRTYDLNRHYQKENIEELNARFEEKFGKRVVHGEGPYGLPQGVKYNPKCDISKEELRGADLVFSRFVLEHVTPEAMEKMHLHFKKQLQPGAYIIHFISPSDHRAYDDSSLSLQDFLRYSQEEWDRMQTRFDYHNRWRLPQYTSLFQELGFEIVHLEYENPKKDSESHKKFKSVALHPEFQQFSEEELTAGSINIVLKV